MCINSCNVSENLERQNFIYIYTNEICKRNLEFIVFICNIRTVIQRFLEHVRMQVFESDIIVMAFCVPKRRFFMSLNVSNDHEQSKYIVCVVHQWEREKI